MAGVLANMDGIIELLARLLYGTGMRLMEAMRLRVKDVDFDRLAIIVREAKGGKDRVVFANPFLSTLCATALQLICCKLAQIFERCRSCWGILTYQRR